VIDGLIGFFHWFTFRFRCIHCITACPNKRTPPPNSARLIPTKMNMVILHQLAIVIP
jgi:hypothetical protein